MEEMAARIQDVPPEQFEPLEEITGGLRPVASTLSAAWDALIRTIPLEKPAEEPNPQATWESVWTANHHA